MLDSAKKIWFYIVSLFFIIANGILLYNERFEFIGFPILALLAYLAIFKLDVVYYIVIFLVPISINLDELGVDLGVGNTSTWNLPRLRLCRRYDVSQVGAQPLRTRTAPRSWGCASSWVASPLVMRPPVTL